MCHKSHMSTKTTAVSISMPDALARRVKAAAKREQMTISEFIRAALRARIETENTKTK